MFVEIISDAGGWPKYVSHENDPLFKSEEWRSLIAIEKKYGTLKDEIFSVPYCPRSHPFVERLIGSVRRECLDQTFFFNKVDLERKLSTYQDYYNEGRVHSSNINPIVVAFIRCRLRHKLEFEQDTLFLLVLKSSLETTRKQKLPVGSLPNFR